MEKIRVDIYLYEHKMVESRSLAQRLVMAGEVLVNGEKVLKPSQQIDDKAKVEIIQGPKFVSRGGEKLEGGLLTFGLANLKDKICVDVGSSTGGFTDCLLQNGAKKPMQLMWVLGFYIGSCEMIRVLWSWNEPMPEMLHLFRTQ